MGTGLLFSVGRDIRVALALALLLGAAWAIRDWPHLAALRLPDDGVRLQQIRDWLAGQRFADLARHRLRPPSGMEMHGTGVADLLPVGMILPFGPPIGAEATTIAAATSLCTGPAATARVTSLPPGMIAAPIDLGANLLPSSRHRLLAGPYRRTAKEIVPWSICS
ncbi:hypothetical protein [Sphingomonas pokkalii]|uniref:Uncharacterized protein n=1 Tax=Sphingomonas pokkalii TaxID=2175090 RepID=A0A2U0S9E1_9SPHN|nr:hypothetical protein [Sphingomonas pokkalii]PVX27993.1 hypothetical protein DD559_00370 [Sphingomonas pokkalii]